MNLRSAATWFGVGLVLATCLQLLQGALSAPAMTLRVGEESSTARFISQDLGEPLPLVEGHGHDGRYSYLVARDPFALRGLADLEGIGGYRFRRVLYSWLAGGFGILPPRAVLWGLILWSATGYAAAAAAVSLLARQLGTRWWAPLGVLANIGLILSIQLSTADTLALALALWGVVSWMSGRKGWAIAALAAAGLAKDYYLLFGYGIAGFQVRSRGWRSGVLTGLLVSIPLGMWVAWLALHTGNSLSAQDNLAAPFIGMARAVQMWATKGDFVLGLAALVSFAAALLGVVVARRWLLYWLTIPWLCLAAVSSVNVWRFGNNAVRALAPLWTLAILAFAVRLGQSNSS